MSVMSSVFVKLVLKRSFLVRNTSHQFIIFQVKPRYYSRKRNQIGTYGPFKIVKADQLCDESGNLNHVNNINWELFATNGYPFFMPGNVGPAWQNTETSESFVQLIASTLAAATNQQPLFKIHHSSSSNQKQQTNRNNKLKPSKKTATNKTEIKSNKNSVETQCDLDKDSKDLKIKKTSTTTNNNNKSNENQLSCIVNECPMVLRKGVIELFGNTNGGRLVDLKSSILTVVTLVQYPKNIYQRSTTDTELNIENDDDIIEKLAKNFVLAAQDICMTLTIMGYWADFINPFSGKPYFSSQTSSLTSSIYNTDQRFRCLDFQIVKQNNCTIIKNDKQHEYSPINDDTNNNNSNTIVDNNNTTKMNTTQQFHTDSASTTVNIEDASRIMFDRNSTTDADKHVNDTFIGSLFTNAPHDIGYLLDIKTQSAGGSDKK
ncbi:retinoblastoma-like protein A [Chrysoperla carnea]|uniref:retinoblastoma-like protein A n=1 Tax=Chrysoperla carnea TaxID=189513 RepID=UPI001D07AC0C|nr:retinoblastoma-like protein A [Chrysoperla carnea]